MKSIGTPRESSSEPAAPAYFVWKAPEAPLHIGLSLEVVRRIREYLTAPSSGAADRKRGGLFLGKAEDSGVQIHDYVPLLADEFGSHFVQSKFSRRELRSYIQELNHLAGFVKVVGYFRSDLGEGIRLFEEDLAFIRDYFPDPSSVFLVVRPGEALHPSAGFFFWQNASVFSAFSQLEFTFDERVLASAPTEAVAARQDLAIRYSAPIVEAPHWTPPSVKVREKLPLPQGRLLGAGLAIIACLALGAYFLRPAARTPAVQESTGFRVLRPSVITGLTVSGPANDLNIGWNGQLPLISGARVGMLTIKDGELHREVPLTPIQLQSGGFKYSIQGDTIQVVLEIFAHDGKVTREAVTVISDDLAPPKTVTVARTSPDPITAPDPTKVPAANTAAEKPREPARSFVPPASRPTIVSPADALSIEPPPSQPVIGQTEVPRLNAATNGWPAAPNYPPIAPPKSDVPVVKQPEPVPPPPVSQPALRPPVPLRQVRPVLPPNVQGMLSNRVNVQVRVQVDASGKVTGAEPLAVAGPMGKFLGKTAANAARMWTFEPANDGSRKVPGEFTIDFTFVPERAR